MVVVRGVGIENRSAPQLLAVDDGHLREIAHFLPIGADDVDLLVDDGAGFGAVEVVDVGGGDAHGDLAAASTGAIDGHDLVRLAAGPGIRADVIGWRETEFVTVPEGSVIAGMVIGVADEDVERYAGKQFAQRRSGIRETCTDLVGEVGVACIPCAHLVETEHGQRRHHCEAGAAAWAVEPFD